VIDTNIVLDLSVDPLTAQRGFECFATDQFAGPFPGFGQ